MGGTGAPPTPGTEKRQQEPSWCFRLPWRQLSRALGLNGCGSGCGGHNPCGCRGLTLASPALGDRLPHMVSLYSCVGAQECTLISTLAAEEERRVYGRQKSVTCAGECAGLRPVGAHMGREKQVGSSGWREEQGMLGAMAARRVPGQMLFQAASLSIRGLDLTPGLCGGDRHLGTSLGQTLRLRGRDSAATAQTHSPPVFLVLGPGTKERRDDADCWSAGQAGRAGKGCRGGRPPVGVTSAAGAGLRG